MKVKMRKNRVLLRQSVENLTSSGIQTSVDSKARDLREVLAVGEGVEDIKPGDHVLVNHLTVKSVEIENEEYGVCLDDAVYGVVGEGNEIPKQPEPESPSKIITQRPSQIIIP